MGEQREEERDVRSPNKSQKSQRACEEGGGWSKAAAGRRDRRGTLLQLQLAELSILSLVPVQRNRTDLYPRQWQPFTVLSPSSSSCLVPYEPSGGTSWASTLKRALLLPPSPLHLLPLMWRKRQIGFQRRRSLRRGIRVALEAPGRSMLEHQLQSSFQQAGPSSDH